MRKVVVLGALAGLGFLGIGGCAQILGDFTTTSVKKDASTPDVVDDIPGTPDVSQDQVVPPPDVGPKCGQITEQCCSSGPACNKGACCANTCLDVDNDPKNCGTCGHDCGGAKCVAGKCLPVEIGLTTDKDATSLVFDGGHLFFTTINSNNGSVFDCPVQGCATPPAKVISGLAFPGDVAVNATTVFAPDFNNNKLHSINRNNLNDTSVQWSSPYALDIDGPSLYVTSISVPLQVKLDFTSQLPLNDGSSEGAQDIATDTNQNVFWSRVSPNQIRYGRTGVQNGAGLFWDSGGLATATVAASKQYVAWSETDTNTGKSNVRSCPAAPSACAQAQTLDSGRFLGYRTGNIIVAGPDVYWTARDPFSKQVEVYRAPGAGGSPKLVAVYVTNGIAVPGGVARPQGNFVYFLAGDNLGTHLIRAEDP